MNFLKEVEKIFIRPIGRWIKKNPNAFLNDISGLIHVGASTGQERDDYAEKHLDVIWVEPIPAVFDELKANIERYERQTAYNALLSESDD